MTDHGGKRTGAGRPKGSRSRRRLEMEKKARAVEDVMREALGREPFEGDSHALLMSCYKNTALPLPIRLEAAKAAIPYERPRLASVEHHGNLSVSHHEDRLDALINAVPAALIEHDGTTH